MTSLYLVFRTGDSGHMSLFMIVKICSVVFSWPWVSSDEVCH